MNNTVEADARLFTWAVNKCFESSLGLLLGSWALRLFHHIYTVYVFAAQHFAEFRSLVHRPSFRRTDAPEFYDNFRREVSGLKKLPVHLVLVLGPDKPSYPDLVRLITWCLLAGTSHVSIYDHKNGLDCFKFYETFCSLAKQHLHKIKWGKSFDEEVKRLSTKRINGYSWSPALTVNLLQREDGLQKIVETVKKLHVEKVEEINLQELNHRLRILPGMPDPDLAIICGSLFTLYGCCPWNMRITQMQLLNSHNKLSAAKFLSVLREYNGCVQRYGK